MQPNETTTSVIPPSQNLPNNTNQPVTNQSKRLSRIITKHPYLYTIFFVLVWVLISGIFSLILFLNFEKSQQESTTDNMTSEETSSNIEGESNKNKDVECSAIKDDVCPAWCSSGADYDCCVAKPDYEWVEGKGCYSSL